MEDWRKCGTHSEPASDYAEPATVLTVFNQIGGLSDAMRALYSEVFGLALV